MSVKLVARYPMYVINVEILLKMERILHHQAMLEKGPGVMMPWEPWMHGRTIFVSHEWLSYSHPDPHGEQFRTLKRILERLMNGEIAYVESGAIEQLALGHNTKVASAKWMAALPYSYVWLDFMSIPQTCDFDPEGHISEDSGYFTKAYSDTSEGGVLKNLQLAVDSIPAYVERSSLLLVLVPICMHVAAPPTHQS